MIRIILWSLVGLLAIVVALLWVRTRPAGVVVAARITLPAVASGPVLKWIGKFLALAAAGAGIFLLFNTVFFHRLVVANEFSFDAGQEVSTIYIEEGTRFDACSNRRWIMGRASVHEIPAGCLCVSGPGRVWATGVEDGTVLRFERRKS